MVGTPCCAASITASPQPSLRDGSTCTQASLQRSMFGVRRRRGRGTSPRRRCPAARHARRGADATSRRRGCPGAGPGSGAAAAATASSASSICLCGTSRESTTTRGCRRPRGGQGVRRRRVDAVAHHGDPGRVDAEVGQVAGRRQRDRDVLVAAVRPRRQLRLDEPAETATSTGPPPATARGGSGAPARPPACRTPAWPGTAPRSGCRRRRRAGRGAAGRGRSARAPSPAPPTRTPSDGRRRG